eukprot:CAMPEP_0181034076 /NCGR_PEP_ID=MMETSP1070-20121207/7616_1 /TAXON_ID=265543 /ORGANISM="Minutocellus polymorphus, Strain NH13" /LENGTH=1222 /DNA_ID=CAMNT_0023111583 /DNA_START=327 /DNA_END=3995 /DNA_ORIENTATION=-
MIVSNTTLDILDRALRGDHDALTYLTNTASIFIFDTATDPSNPHVYGCWNFFNQTLTEVERYEAQYGHYAHHPGEGLTPPHLQGQHRPGPASLAPHVQLLTTLSRRAARRPPAADRALVTTCLTNASRSGAYNVVGSPDQHSRLLTSAMETRESLLGRIAALAFDFALHSPHGPSSTSAFADPVSMEGLCTIVAANAVSSGPEGLRHLVVDWIVPASSADQLPHFSSAAVCAHLADEAMSNRGAPAGTSAALQSLFDVVVSGVVGPLLAEAVRDSDSGNGSDGRGGPTRNQRVAAMALRALERWCAATGAGIGQVKRICSDGETKIDIVEVISDALYSDSEAVIDAAAELLDTLLKKNAEDTATMESLSLVSTFMQSVSGGSAAAGLVQTEEAMRLKEAERDVILVELVSAVGLQRLRFDSASSAACRCLARIAAAIALAAQSSIRSGKMGRASNGLLELLLKGAAHPSIHVCGICLEAIPSLIAPGSNYSDRLLPILQQRAIVPATLRGNRAGAGGQDADVDFHEYTSFRENLLSAALAACYKNNRSFYMESCASAIDEFCAAPLTPQLPFQLEAALFCLCAVSMDASKRALLVGASPAAQSAAAKASVALGQAQTADIAADAKKHDEELAKCTFSIAQNPATATSNPLTLAQMCRFIAKYSRWYSKTQSAGALDKAAELALTAFNATASPDYTRNEAVKDLIDEMVISPVAEAATALRNILTRSPGRFTTPEALAALESGWKASYTSANSEEENIKVEDREALCSGLCRVLAALPSDQWVSSLTALATPTIQYLEAASKKAEELVGKEAEQFTILDRMADEIKLLSVMVRTFRNAARKSESSDKDPNPALIAVLHRAWPCLSHVSEKLGSYAMISRSLSDLLTCCVAVQQSDSEHEFFLQVCNMAANIMAAVKSSNGESEKHSTQAPMLHFVEEAVDIYGHVAETVARGTSKSTNADLNLHKILDRLLVLSFEAVEEAAGAIWASGSEHQQQGETAGEASPPPPPAARPINKSPDELAAMFSLLTVALRRSPVLLLNLSSGKDLFSRAVQAGTVAMNEKEVDVSRSALIFLKTLADLKAASENDERSGATYQLISSDIDESIYHIRGSVVNAAVAGACGIYPREVLDPAASLLSAFLQASSPEEAELAATASLQQGMFKLGDDAKRAVLVVLGKAAQGRGDASLLMEVFDTLWSLHQGEDAHTFAGGDAVAKFVSKYGQQ